MEKQIIASGLALLLASLPSLCRSADLLDHWVWRSPLPTGNLINAATWGDNAYVAVGAYGTILTSPDGIAWTSQSSGVTTALFNVAYGNGLFVAVGMGGKILTSPDGRQWTPRLSDTGSHLFAVAWGNDRFVAVGSQVVTSSLDGLTWSAASSGVGFSSIVFGNGLYVAVGN